MEIENINNENNEFSKELVDSLGEFNDFLKKAMDLPESCNVVYHYSTIAALHSGLLVKKNEKDINEQEAICLWASNTEYLNDPHETFIVEKFLKEISDKYPEGNIEKNIEYNNTSFSDPSFVISFSTNKDSLPMWSMYGDNGSGIAFGFDVNTISQIGDAHVKPCVYMDENFKSKFHSLASIIKETTSKDSELGIGFWGSFLASLLAPIFGKAKKEKKEIINVIRPLSSFLVFLKDSSYKYENEVRLILPRPLPSSLSPDDSIEIKYRLRDNLIIPYQEFNLPRAALKEIIVGPRNDMARTIKSIEEYIKYLGFSDVKVSGSEVPYRG